MVILVVFIGVNSSLMSHLCRIWTFNLSVTSPNTTFVVH